MRIVPKWKDEWSDGCSIPKLLRPLFKKELSCKSIQAVCLLHDEEYYYGGTEADRQAADKRFYQQLMIYFPSWKAYLWYQAVRIGGGPERRKEKVSWAFGPIGHGH